jgi:hypothetical protein
MAATGKCERCGGENLQPGDLTTEFFHHPILFRPRNKRLLTLHAGPLVTAFVCLDCGAVQLTADVEAVQGLLKTCEVDRGDEPAPAEAFACLACGTTIEAGTSECPKCGWSYVTGDKPAS